MSLDFNPLKLLIDLAQADGTKVITGEFTYDIHGMVSKVSGYLLLKDGLVRTVSIDLVPNDEWPQGIGLVTRVDLRTGERRRLNIVVNDNGPHPFTVSIKPPRRPPWSRPGWED